MYLWIRAPLRLHMSKTGKSMSLLTQVILACVIITRDAHGSVFFFFFVVATNLHINLFIKLSPLLEGMYCSDCLQQKRPNENLLLARISRGREPPHPYLCDVNSSFDLFIKPGLNSGGHIAYKF